MGETKASTCHYKEVHSENASKGSHRPLHLPWLPGLPGQLLLGKNIGVSGNEMSIYQLTQSSMVYVIGICEQERERCDGIVAL